MQGVDGMPYPCLYVLYECVCVLCECVGVCVDRLIRCGFDLCKLVQSQHLVQALPRRTREGCLEMCRRTMATGATCDSHMPAYRCQTRRARLCLPSLMRTAACMCAMVLHTSCRQLTSTSMLSDLFYYDSWTRLE